MIRNPKYVYGPRNLQVPANINFADFILGRLWKHGSNVALIDGATDQRITYKEIAQQAMNFAISLARMGIKKGDTIGIMSENRLEYPGAVVGAASVAAVVTTINTGYIKGELIHVLNISKPKYMILSPVAYKTHRKTLKTLSFIEKIILFGEESHSNAILYNDLSLERNKAVKDVKYEDFLSVEVQGQTDALFIMYSSGTTGLPKGVMLTHLNIIAACSMPPSLAVSDAALAISPWYHVMGLMGIVVGLTIGRTSIYLAKFDMDLYLRTIAKYKISQLTVVPPVLVAACKYQSNYDLSSVKLIYSGAAPLPISTIENVRDKFPNCQAVLQGYGATELTLGVTRCTPDSIGRIKTGSVGTIVPNTTIKVVNIETRQPVGANTPGEICAKGELLMKGYYGQNVEDFDDEGFYKTGDIGYYDDDGHFFIVDRLKELIKYKGFQVPPAELEAVLLLHPSIKDAGVIGVEDRVAGEVPLAFVVTQPEKQVTEKEVKDFVADRLSNPKHLRGGVRFVDQIPKSATGKILRKELRNMFKSTKSRL